MAEQTFGTGFNELLVVADGDTVGFITQGREDLGHDEVRKLIAFLHDIVGQGLSREQLDALPEGMGVYDNEMEKWTKYGYEWKFYVGNLLRSSVDLIEQYGPITVKDGVGSSRHADKTETGDTP